MSLAKSTARYAQSTARQANVKRTLNRLIVVVVFGVLLYYFRWHGKISETAKTLTNVPPPSSVNKAIVAAKTRFEEVDWMLELLPEWTPYIYSTSRPHEAPYLPLASTRGREAMAYLTYIIDNYATGLPPYTAFIHAGPSQRHNDLLGPSNVPLLKNLRLDTVDKRGYVNLRCTLDPGCPVGVNPLDPTEIDIAGHDIRAYFADVYMELFDVPSSAVPREIGGVCCAQFVVSRAKILERPREDYERMRRWAVESTVTDNFGVGWTFEKVWHVVFGMGDQYCLDFETCRCELLGWCGPIPENCTAAEPLRVEEEV